MIVHTIRPLIYSCICLLLLLPAAAQQRLQAGFNGPEYLEVLRINGRINDTSITGEKPPPPLQYELQYRSPEVGLVNQWDAWLSKDKKVAVISLRGTIQHLASWLANFYAAMVPAQGELQLNDSTRFTYKLAENPTATVHVGWLVGMAHMAPAIAERIRDYHKQGVKDIIIVGHSQGGALSFLLRSWLHYQQQAGNIPSDIRFKTYCSAAPKPGNMQYVYDFDYITRNGWAFNVVNAPDWVPETPFSIQSLNDFNEANPFVNVGAALKNQKVLVRWYLNHAFNSMSRASARTQKRFRKYLGKTVYKQVKKFLPQLKEPTYVQGCNYMRAGSPVILMPDEYYNQTYKFDGKNVFIHHMPNAYYYLANKIFGDIKP